MMNAVDLLVSLTELCERYPTAKLEKNEVGNLAVYIDGRYCGYIDLATGELDLVVSNNQE